MALLSEDLRYTFRMLAKSPGFTITALAVLAVGIGANIAIFSVVNAVVLKPLLFPDPSRLVMFVLQTPQGQAPFASATKFNLYRERTDLFQDVAAYSFGVLNLTSGAVPEQIASCRVSAGFFQLFGAPIVRGRAFTAEEDSHGAALVAVIGEGLWRRRFGGDPSIVGKSIALSGESYQVIGIISASFNASVLGAPADVWVPFQLDPNSTDQANYFSVAGQLKTGITITAANQQLQVATQEFRRRFPVAIPPKGSFMVQPFQEFLVSDVRASLQILASAVGLVLLIACANVANLLLVRSISRKREIAIRCAIGAGRGRILRQLLSESAVLSLMGGALGLVLGMVGIRVLLAASPGNIPGVGPGGSLVALDWRIVLFTILVSSLSAVLFGFIPALQASRVDLSSAFQEGGSRSGGSLHQSKGRAVLVVSEMALALILLVGSALLIRTFIAVRSVNPGFDSHNVLTMRMSLTGPRFEKTVGVDQLVRDAKQRIEALPGVVTAAATCCVPLQGGYGLPFIIPGRPLEGPFTGQGGWVIISPGYFESFNVPVLRGRAFNEQDGPSNPGVAIINQSMAQKFWSKGNDPLDDRILIGKGVGPEFEGDRVRQIVGIVGDIRDGGLNRDPRPTMYVPESQVLDGVNALNARLGPLAWVVRTKVEPYSLSTAIQEQLREASGGLPVAEIRSMDQIVVQSTARENFNMLLMTVFAGSALLLAAIGIYGLISYSVEQRTQEIGIRLALGAESRGIRNMILSQGMRLALIGVVIGAGSAFGLARLIATVLFGVKPWDPLVFVSATLLLSTIALGATWIPAFRASRVDPADALRHE